MPAGRPSKLTPEIIKQAERFARLGLTDVQMAEAWGVSESSLNRWKANEEFRESLKDGKAFSDAKIAESLYARAQDGDVTACIFWLKNRQPTAWRDKREIDTTVTGQLTMADVVAQAQESSDD